MLYFSPLTFETLVFLAMFVYILMQNHITFGVCMSNSTVNPFSVDKDLAACANN